MCVALVVGNSIGSGVFLLPASLAPYGLNSPISWAFTAAGAISLALVFTQLSRAHPAAGGPYAYTRLAFGPLTAFLGAWGYWISVWVGNAAIATGTVSYLSSLIPWIASSREAPAIVTLTMLWGLTFVNWYGVRAAGWVQSITTVLKILPLIAIAAAGIFAVRASDFAAAAKVMPISLHGVTAGATLTLWAMLGLESATIPATKVRDPSRTIPAATLLGTVLTAVICLIACSTVVLLVPAGVLAHSNAPFVDLAVRLWGHRAGVLVAAFAAISGFGALNGWILLQGEVPHAMAKTGVFPQVFAIESPRRTPTFALVFSSGLITALVLMNYQQSMVRIFTFMILLSTTACLVTYALCALALLRLMWTGHMRGARLGAASLAVIGGAALLYSLWAIAGAGPEANAWGFILFICGVPLYFLVRARRAP